MSGTFNTEADVVLIGAGIMSSTLGVFLKELEPSLCACRKLNSHIQMMKSAKKWRRQNATNGMYGSGRRRVLVD